MSSLIHKQTTALVRSPSQKSPSPPCFELSFPHFISRILQLLHDSVVYLRCRRNILLVMASIQIDGFLFDAAETVFTSPATWWSIHHSVSSSLGRWPIKVRDDYYVRRDKHIGSDELGWKHYAVEWPAIKLLSSIKWPLAGSPVQVSELNSWVPRPAALSYANIHNKYKRYD